MNVKTKIIGAVAAPIAGLALLAMVIEPGPAAAAGSHAQAQGSGQGMMGGTMKMMRGMMAQGPMGQSMMGQSKMGQGMRVVPSLNITVKDVRLFMEKRLGRLGNKRLKVGAVKQADERTITADIVTVDNSLVRRFTVDRNTGWVKKAK